MAGAKDEIFAGMDAYAVKALGLALMGDQDADASSFRAELPAVRCPTTVIAGEHDHPMVDQAPALAAEVANGRLDRHRGCVPLTAADARRAVAGRGARPPRLGRRDTGRAVTDGAPPQANDLITLAGTDVAIPPLGVGTWAWGDKGTWGMGGYDPSLTEASIREAWEASIEAGVVLFDTAEVYGGGESERIIGRLLAADPGVRDRGRHRLEVHAAARGRSTCAPHCFLRRATSRERLGIGTIDLYQIHGPISLRSHDALAEALAAARAEGLVRAVGVSNYSEKETRAIDAALQKQGLRLASNQIEFSLLRAMPLRVGLIDGCHELGVVPLAYSPIGQGRLTGKYSAANPPSAKRTFSAHPMEQVDAVVAELRAHRRGPRGPHAEPGRAGLAYRQGLGAHPGGEEPGTGGAERRRTGVAADRRGGVAPRRGFPLRQARTSPARLATRLNPAVPS